LVGERGSPRYGWGKKEMAHPCEFAMAEATHEETCIGIMHDLWKLIARPVAAAKSSRTLLRQAAAVGEALQRIRVSSAY
jgi:hypothetical protein